MTYRTAPPPARRLVLVPAARTGRGDELVRRYRLAQLQLAGREAAVTAARHLPPARSG